MICKSKWMFLLSLIAGCALTGLPAFAQTTTAPTTPPEPPKPVVVVNPPSAPVPTAAQGTTTVAGTVNVGNTPNVNVTNTPNVNITNTPSVSLIGSPTVTLAPGASTTVTNTLDGQNNPSPLAVLEAIQPYEDRCTAHPANGGNTAGCNFNQIPDGTRLVVEEFDAEVDIDTDVKPLEVTLNVSNVAPKHFFSMTFMGSVSSSGLGIGEQNVDYFATHQSTKLYAPASSTPSCAVFLSRAQSSFNSASSFSCTLSGFLVDVQ